MFEQIPRTSWPMFFDQVTCRHRSLPLALFFARPAGGSRYETTGSAFQGAIADESAVSVRLLDGAGETVERSINHVADVWRLWQVDGGEEIEIQAWDGAHMTLGFARALTSGSRKAREAERALKPETRKGGRR